MCVCVHVLTVPSDGRQWRSVAGLSWSVLWLWRLFGSLVAGSGTGWWESGSVPNQLCEAVGGSQRDHFVRRSWMGHPFLWASARTSASAEDCHLEESPDCCYWGLGYLQRTRKQYASDEIFELNHSKINKVIRIHEWDSVFMAKCSPYPVLQVRWGVLGFTNLIFLTKKINKSTMLLYSLKKKGSEPDITVFLFHPFFFLVKPSQSNSTQRFRCVMLVVANASSMSGVDSI